VTSAMSCELARRSVRRGAAASSACGCGNTVGPTLTLDRGQFFWATHLNILSSPNVDGLVIANMNLICY